jgi:hypothetical protein
MAAVIFVDWNMGFSLFAFESAGPFLILMVVAVLIAIWNKSQVIVLISRASVPAGALVAALNAMHMFTSPATDPETAMFSTRLIFAPMGLGMIFSYLVPLIEPVDANFELTLSRAKQLASWALSLVAIYVVWTFIIQSTVGIFEGFIDLNSVVISVAVMAICMVYPGNENLSMHEKAVYSGLFICVMAAVLGVAFYSSAVAMGSKFIGQSAAFGLLTTLYGSFVVFVATILGGQSSMNAAESRYFDWHLIESWIFLALMLMAPRTLIELFI